MPKDLQSLRQLADQILIDIETLTNQDTPAVNVAYNRIIANASAAMALLNQTHNIDMVKECFPQTATEDFGLKLWSELVSRPREAGEQAELQISVTGTNGEVISDGSTGPRWKASSGVTYTTKTGDTITGGTASIAILADQFGTEGTLQVGDEVNLTTTIPGLNPVGIVTAINVTGAEEESVESWRAAIVQLAAFPPNIGTAAWFYNEALQIPGITRAYPYVDQNFPGKVIIYAVADENVDGIPTTPQLEAIEQITSQANKNIMWASDLLPNGDKRLEALASPIDIYDVVITEGTPALSLAQKDAIDVAVDNYFITRNPFILGLSPLDQGSVEEVGITAVIQNTLDSLSGETGKFIDVGLTKQGDAPAESYILEPGTRAKPNISYT